MKDEDQKKELSIGIKLAIFIVLIISYLISPFLALFLSFISIAMFQQSAVVSLVCGFSLSYPALFYNPLVTDDSSRILNIVHEMQGISPEGLYHWLSLWAGDYLNYPLFTWLMYIVAKNFQDTALPFIVAGISYSVVIYLGFKFSKLFKLSLLFKYLTIVASVVWISYLELISGMRFTLACVISLLIICHMFLFDNTIKRRHYISIAWFIMPLLIHPGVVLILVPLFFIFFLKQKNTMFKVVILLLFVLALMFFFSNVSSRFMYVLMLKKRLFSYSVISFGYVSSPQHIVHFFLAIITGIIGFMELRVIKTKNFEEKWLFDNLYILVGIYTAYFFIAIISLNFGMRLAMVMPILFIFAISSATSQLLDDNKSELVNLFLLCMIIVLGLFFNANFLDIDFSGMQVSFFNVGFN